MTRINNKFLELSKKNEKALIAYIMIGYPDIESTISIIKGLIKGGIDMIELGYPFSDPLADGPIIQNAGNIALKKMTIKKFFGIVKEIRKITNIPLIIMTYTNILYKYGYERFILLAKNYGIDGIILPDMIIEEANDYVKIARLNNIDTIFLVAPNTDNKRIKKLCNICRGFLYIISTYGTTGSKTNLKEKKGYINKIKSIAGEKIPIGIGFGISTQQDIKELSNTTTDAIIVGSAIIRVINGSTYNNISLRLSKFIKKLKQYTKIN